MVLPIGIVEPNQRSHSNGTLAVPVSRTVSRERKEYEPWKVGATIFGKSVFLN